MPLGIEDGRGPGLRGCVEFREVRMKSFVTSAAVIGITAAGFLTNPAQADMASGAVLTYTCYSCHGTDGKSVGDMPTIAGKSKEFIVKKLNGFKNGKNDPTVMNRIAKGFTDDEIIAIADFFSKKK